MFRDADPGSFAAIYIVCGRTNLRYGIDSLAAIIETRYKLPLFVPNTLFLFCGLRANRIKGLVWEGDGFLLFTKRVEEGRFTWLITQTFIVDEHRVHVYASRNNDGTIYRAGRPADFFENSLATPSLNLISVLE